MNSNYAKITQKLRKKMSEMNGRKHAIVLTMEMQAELLLMDERVGREVARHFGLHYTGLIGVLAEAKHKGVLSAVKPMLDALRNIAGFRIRDTLYERVSQDEWAGS